MDKEKIQALMESIVTRLIAFERPRSVKERLKDWTIDSVARLVVKISRKHAEQLQYDLEFYLNKGE